MRDMLRGLQKFGTPAMCLGMVDVRDVAKAHVEAAIRPDAEGRFLLVADSKTFLEAGQILRERLGNKYPFPKSTLPNLLFYVIGLTQGLTWKVVRATLATAWLMTTHEVVRCWESSTSPPKPRWSSRLSNKSRLIERVAELTSVP